MVIMVREWSVLGKSVVKLVSFPSFGRCYLLHGQQSRKVGDEQDGTSVLAKGFENSGEEDEGALSYFSWDKLSSIRIVFLKKEREAETDKYG